MVQSEENKNKKLFLVAQEIELAKLLAGNNKNVRDKALRNLKKWFHCRSQAVPFTDDDFQRIWKGLFYSMWMCDKPLVQEECAENISNLVHFPTLNLSLQFFKAGLTVITNEWFGIDQLRLDKFLMLVRRFLRQMFIVLKKRSFNKENIEKFNEVISNTVLSTTGKVPLGLTLHFYEIFLEELSKVTEGRIHPDSVTEILRPFIKKLVSTDDGRQVGHIRKFIFTYLIRQTDLGLEYQEKYEAWKKLGFPGSINSMQKIKIDDFEKLSSDELEDIDNSQTKVRPLDPRAGRVDVELPQLKFNAKKLSEILMDYKFDKNGSKRGMKMINILSNQFAMLANGKYPLGKTKLEIKEENESNTNIRKAANKLIKFEQKLRSQDMKRKRNKSVGEEKEFGDIPKRKRQKIINNDKDSGNNIVLSEKKKQEVEDNVIQKLKKTRKNELHKFSNGIESVKKGVNNKESIEDSLTKKKESDEDQENSSKKKHKIVTIDNTKNLNKLKRIKQNAKRTKKQSVIDNIECVFKRNSGTWVVFDVSKKSNKSLLHNQKGTPEDAFDEISLKNHSFGDFEQGDFKSIEQSSPIKTEKLDSLFNTFEKLNNESSPYKSISPEKLKKPIKLLESPPRGRALFPKTEWDEALQDGEYEVFVPSKKYLKKMQKLAEKNGHINSQVVVTPSQNNQVKSRRSLDQNLLKNPFSTPNKTKKVKINTKLNRSQEIYEHHMQILSSPGIPHDPSKKPMKPVLKSPARTNSINPFYDKQLSIW